MTLNDYLEESIRTLQAAVTADLSAEMTRATELVATALSAGRPLLTCGNGGSACDALHIATELVGRFHKRERRGLNVISLSANTPLLTAWANDYDYDTVFSRQVEAHGSAGGVLLAITTSGTSKNILLAAEAARSCGMMVIGLTGPSGGRLAPLCDVALKAPGASTPVIQQVHLCLYHYLCDAVEVRMGFV